MLFFGRENEVGARAWDPARNPPNRTGGAVALKVRMRLHPAGDPLRKPVREVLYPSFGVHVEVSWSAAAKRARRPRRFPQILKSLGAMNAAGARFSWRRRSQKPLHAPLS